MNFELLTFPCREMSKLSIHIGYVSKINTFIYRKTHLLCDACIVYIDIAKLQMHFLHYAFFFLAKSHVSVPFSLPFLGRIE